MSSTIPGALAATWMSFAGPTLLPDRTGVLVTLSGEIDVLACQPLATLAAALPRDHVVVADASAVTFLDCAGWSAVERLVDGDASRLVLRDPSSAVTRLLTALGALGEHRVISTRG